jgi:hypothetical protein
VNVPDDLRKMRIPGMHATDTIPLFERKAVIKFYHPYTDWKWYGIEYNGFGTFFGLIIGEYVEFGYFSVEELNDIVIERETIARDPTFKPTKIEHLILNASGVGRSRIPRFARCKL